MNRPNQWEEKYDLNGSLMVNEYLNDLEEYCDVLEKALNKALYKWIVHEDPKIIYASGHTFDPCVERTIEYNKKIIMKEVQDGQV